MDKRGAGTEFRGSHQDANSPLPSSMKSCFGGKKNQNPNQKAEHLDQMVLRGRANTKHFVAGGPARPVSLQQERFPSRRAGSVIGGGGSPTPVGASATEGGALPGVWYAWGALPLPWGIRKQLGPGTSKDQVCRLTGLLLRCPCKRRARGKKGSTPGRIGLPSTCGREGPCGAWATPSCALSIARLSCNMEQRPYQSLGPPGSVALPWIQSLPSLSPPSLLFSRAASRQGLWPLPHRCVPATRGALAPTVSEARTDLPRALGSSRCHLLLRGVPLPVSTSVVLLCVNEGSRARHLPISMSLCVT